MLFLLCPSEVMCGHPACTNHWSLHSSALCFPQVPGRSSIPAYLTNSKQRCLKCGLPVEPLRGIVCANFGRVRGPGIPGCKGAWHAACYRQKSADCFPVLELLVLDDDLLDLTKMEEQDEDQFKVGRTGDHLMCPFQCDVCSKEGTLCPPTRRITCWLFAFEELCWIPSGHANHLRLSRTCVRV